MSLKIRLSYLCKAQGRPDVRARSALWINPRVSTLRAKIGVLIRLVQSIWHVRDPLGLHRISGHWCDAPRINRLVYFVSIELEHLLCSPYALHSLDPLLSPIIRERTRSRSRKYTAYFLGETLNPRAFWSKMHLLASHHHRGGQEAMNKSIFFFQPGRSSPESFTQQQRIRAYRKFWYLLKKPFSKLKLPSPCLTGPWNASGGYVTLLEIEGSAPYASTFRVPPQSPDGPSWPCEPRVPACACRRHSSS